MTGFSHVIRSLPLYNDSHFVMAYPPFVTYKYTTYFLLSWNMSIHTRIFWHIVLTYGFLIFLLVLIQAKAAINIRMVLCTVTLMLVNN